MAGILINVGVVEELRVTMKRESQSTIFCVAVVSATEQLKVQHEAGDDGVSVNDGKEILDAGEFWTS